MGEPEMRAALLRYVFEAPVGDLAVEYRVLALILVGEYETGWYCQSAKPHGYLAFGASENMAVDTVSQGFRLRLGEIAKESRTPRDFFMAADAAMLTEGEYLPIWRTLQRQELSVTTAPRAAGRAPRGRGRQRATRDTAGATPAARR